MTLQARLHEGNVCVHVVTDLPDSSMNVPALPVDFEALKIFSWQVCVSLYPEPQVASHLCSQTHTHTHMKIMSSIAK